METREALRERVRRERQLVDRLAAATVHFADAQIERAWAISSAHQSGLSIRRIAAATDLSASRVHQILNSAEATDMCEQRAVLSAVGKSVCCFLQVR
jgi:hypothetical protein